MEADGNLEALGFRKPRAMLLTLWIAAFRPSAAPEGYLVPAEMKPLGNSRDGGLLHPVDLQSFKEGGEPGVVLGPRDANLPGTVVRTLQARDAGVENCPVLDGIEVAPGPFPVVVDGGSFQTLRTDPEFLRTQNNEEVGLSRGELQSHPLDPPRRLLLLHPEERKA